MKEATTLMRAMPRDGTAGALLVGMGTIQQTTVRDVRSFYRWSAECSSAVIRQDLVIYHHTETLRPPRAHSREEVLWLIDQARHTVGGFPWHFVVMPNPPWRIYYLNDVDTARPHTDGYAGAVGIAAVGNYDETDPPDRMVDRIERLTDALEAAWEWRIERWQHKDVSATSCPGDRLSHLLPRHGRQWDDR